MDEDSHLQPSEYVRSSKIACESTYISPFTFHHFYHINTYSLGKVAEAAYYRILHCEPLYKGYNYSLAEHV